MQMRELELGESTRPKPALCAPHDTTMTIRTPVLESSVGVVENVHSAGMLHQEAPRASRRTSRSVCLIAGSSSGMSAITTSSPMPTRCYSSQVAKITT